MLYKIPNKYMKNKDNMFLRIVEIIGETDWKLQLDNQLPTSLNLPIFIPRHKWHRVIKGTGTLKLKIHKS